jgi:hypothetical protein
VGEQNSDRPARGDARTTRCGAGGTPTRHPARRPNRRQYLGVVLRVAWRACPRDAQAAVREGYLAFPDVRRGRDLCHRASWALRTDEIVDGELPPFLRFWPLKTRLQHWPPPPADNRILPTVTQLRTAPPPVGSPCRGCTGYEAAVSGDPRASFPPTASHRRRWTRSRRLLQPRATPSRASVLNEGRRLGRSATGSRKRTTTRAPSRPPALRLSAETVLGMRAAANLWLAPTLWRSFGPSPPVANAGHSLHGPVTGSIPAAATSAASPTLTRWASCDPTRIGSPSRRTRESGVTLSGAAKEARTT